MRVNLRQKADIHGKSAFFTPNAKRTAALKKSLPLYILAAPAFIWFITFVYYPAVLGFVVSFQKYRIIGKSEWIGLQNYLRVFTTPGLIQVVANTLTIGLFSLILNLLFPVLTALLLNEALRALWKKIIQTSIFIAHLFSWVVVAGIWIYILAPDKGLLNIALSKMHLEPIHFMSSSEYGKPLVIFLILWKDVGYLCILYLATISNINPELYEAALMDGAGRFQQAIRITLPSLVPTIKILMILEITGLFQLFDPIWVLRNSGNSLAIDTVMIYLKKYGIDQFQIGYASAISSLIFITVLAFTLITKQGVRYRV
ncbi:MAG: ABC transporter permease subunit [Spirochaetota bacterium]